MLGPDSNGKLLELSPFIGQVLQAVQRHRSRFKRRRVGSEDLPKLVEVGLLGDKRESEHLFEGGDLTPEVGVRFLELLDTRRGIGVRDSRHRRFNCTKLLEHRSTPRLDAVGGDHLCRTTPSHGRKALYEDTGRDFREIPLLHQPSHLGFREREPARCASDCVVAPAVATPVCRDAHSDQFRVELELKPGQRPDWLDFFVISRSNAPHLLMPEV